MPRSRWSWSAFASLSLVLLTTGCGSMGAVENTNASSAALAFDQALHQPRRACQLLATGTLSELQDSFGPCRQSLPGQHLPVATTILGVDVYGKDALVHLDRDWVFLARFDRGWRVTAAGCTPIEDRPFNCLIKGQ